jgi:hypothetical protein
LAESRTVAPIGSDLYRLLVNLRWHSTCKICWKDKVGAEHIASYIVGQGSRLFQLYEGQTVSVRYKPDSPDQYYIRDLFKHKALLVGLFLLYILGFLANIVYFFIRLWTHFQ